MAKSPEPKTDDTPPDFERSLKDLEDIVTRMEKGDLSLEDSLREFERGIALTRACQEALQAAEQRVQILTEENGRTEPRPFSDGGSED
ncbi:MAG: exodeoxyribonuclease VII small subunit [Gammaproteobacteria bacterium]|jgi:exodeoxyribonuclease VII small subunit|nr:exodeoxyribonuclease VII small subunit [Gammaproteobacteria bacterium]